MSSCLRGVRLILEMAMVLLECWGMLGSTCKCFREALGVEPDAALPGSACDGVKLCPIARHGRNYVGWVSF